MKEYFAFEKLNFLFVDRGSEGFAAAFAQTNSQFRSFSLFVRFTRHLPSFFGLNFLSTFRTFSHIFRLHDYDD
jgi:hypothetical protein